MQWAAFKKLGIAPYPECRQVFFGQLDLFILQWEEVLCSQFDIMVLDPSDRRGTDTSIVASKDKTMGLSLHR